MRFKPFLLALVTVLASITFFHSCTDPDNPDSPQPSLWDILKEFGVASGWLQTTEKVNEIESDINIRSGSGSLPSSVDLRPHFPPIGDQGQYGTCVAWAVGYNMKTVIEGLDKKLSTQALSSPSNQFSPKDLFWALDNNKKGANCNGTNFEPAMDVMVKRGIATLKTVPYDNLGNCSSTPASNWTAEANNYKIANYRKIKLDVSTIKQYLAEKRPVVIGAKLGTNFMRWNSDMSSHQTPLTEGSMLTTP